MTTHKLFPTLVYSFCLQAGRWQAFNDRLLRECRQFCKDDVSGRCWSVDNYFGGYTSYSSASHMYCVSPTFADLERRLARHVKAFVRQSWLDLAGRKLTMTDCWVNIMARDVSHGLYLHPFFTLSGTYYVQTLFGCSGIKFEDPRLDRFMASPLRKRGAYFWVVLPAEAGRLILFESWLRHEVAANPRVGERISISFNYSWF